MSQTQLDLTKQWQNYFVDIHSENRFNLSDPRNKIIIKIADHINLHSHSTIYVATPYITLSPTIYNISEFIGNNCVTWTEDDGSVDTFVVTVPDGNYSIATFLTEFQTQLEAQSLALGKGWEYTFTYNPVTAKLTTEVTNASPPGEFTIDLTGCPFTLASYLGYNKSRRGDSFTSTSGILTSADTVDFAQPRAIYVRSNVLNNQGYETADFTDGKDSSILAVLPLNGNGQVQQGFASVSSFENTRIKVSNPLNTAIEVTLTGEEEDYPLDIRGGWDITVLYQFDPSDTK